MQSLTRRQRQILDFILRAQQQDGVSPSLREIAEHFGFRSMTAALDHVRALCRKGHLAHEPRRPRALRALTPWQHRRGRVVDIPLYGSIPAGFAREREPQAEGCVSVDMDSLGFKPSRNTFALKVTGDSMIGRHILDGDIVVLEHGPEPRPGQIVAALIDGESTLKTFVLKNGKPHLKAENPRYPDLIPAQELMIQGVFQALIRRAKESTTSGRTGGLNP